MNAIKLKALKWQMKNLLIEASNAKAAGNNVKVDYYSELYWSLRNRADQLQTK